MTGTVWPFRRLCHLLNAFGVVVLVSIAAERVNYETHLLACTQA